MQATSAAVRLEGLNLSLFSAIPGNHLVLLPDTPTFTIAAVSDDYLAALNVSRESLINKGVFEVFLTASRHARLAEDLRHSLDTVLVTGKRHYMNDQSYERTAKETGRPEWRIWRPSNRPVLAADSSVACIIHTTEDITSTVQLGEMASINRYLQTIINQFKEPLQILQPVFEGDAIVDFRFKLTNQAYAAYAHTTPEALEGQKVGDVFPGYFDTPSFHNPVRTYETGEPLTFEIHYDKDGLDLYNLMSTSRLGDDVFIHFTDFTELKRLQFQLENKVTELRRSNQYLEEFAYAASHDMKEPIRKILAFATRLQSGLGSGLSDAQADLFGRMQGAAERMGTLIDDLLTYSAVSQAAASEETVDLQDVLSQALADLDFEIEQKAAVVKVGSLGTIQGNRRQLEQAFQNLLSNALKYTRPGVPPVIDISCRLVPVADVAAYISQEDNRNTFQHLSISDNGIGFEPQYAGQIFKVFARLHGLHQYKGSGIGLSTVKKVIENHWGYIWAEGKPGEGAVFHILLPAPEAS
jgi:signal transduction histidine kinase